MCTYTHSYIHTYQRERNYTQNAYIYSYYIYIDEWIKKFNFIHTNTYVDTNMHVYFHTHLHMHTYLRTQVLTYPRNDLHIYTYTYTYKTT